MSVDRDLVVVGAGGHGREAFDLVVESCGAEIRSRIVGFVDDGMAPGSTVGHSGREILGPVDLLEHLEVDYVFGIASPAIRRRLDKRLTEWGRSPWGAVHPAAGMGSGATLGAGCLVPFGCRVSEGVVLGRHVHLGVGNNIAHGTHVGDYSIVTPGAMVSGECRIGTDVWIGAGAIINQGLRVGDRSTVGSGAVVVDDVGCDETVVGVPARLMKIRETS